MTDSQPHCIPYVKPMDQMYDLEDDKQRPSVLRRVRNCIVKLVTFR